MEPFCPLVMDVSITKFVEVLRSNATLDDAVLMDLFVVAGQLASSVEATEADLLVETAESLAFLSSRALEQGSRSADSRRARCGVCVGTISCAFSSYRAWLRSGDRLASQPISWKCVRQHDDFHVLAGRPPRRLEQSYTTSDV